MLDSFRLNLVLSIEYCCNYGLGFKFESFESIFGAFQLESFESVGPGLSISFYGQCLASTTRVSALD